MGGIHCRHLCFPFVVCDLDIRISHRIFFDVRIKERIMICWQAISISEA